MSLPLRELTHDWESMWKGANRKHSLIYVASSHAKTKFYYLLCTKSIYNVWLKFTYKFINLVLNFLNCYTGYNIKYSHTVLPNLYEYFLAKKKIKSLVRVRHNTPTKVRKTSHTVVTTLYGIFFYSLYRCVSIVWKKNIKAYTFVVQPDK